MVGAVKTSFVISHKIAKNSKPLSDGDLIKEYLVHSAVLIYTKKKEALENAPLSRRTITKWIEDIFKDLALEKQNRQF